MRMFRRRSLQWCEEALEAIEEAVASGANTTSFQGHAVSWKSLDDARQIIEDLNVRIAELEGSRKRKKPLSIITVIPNRGL